MIELDAVLSGFCSVCTRRRKTQSGGQRGIKRLKWIKADQNLSMTVQLWPAVTSGHTLIGVSVHLFFFFHACMCVFLHKCVCVSVCVGVCMEDPNQMKYEQNFTVKL